MNAMYRASAIALIAGGGLLSSGADASQLLSFSVFANPAADSDTLNFSKFDGSLGTLTGVHFSLGSSVANVHSGFSITGGEGGSGSASMSATFEILGPGTGGPTALTLFADQATATSSCTTPDGISVLCASVGNDTTSGPSFVSPFDVSNPADLASYIGGGTFSVLVDLSLANVKVDTCIEAHVNQFDQPSCNASASASWGGNLTVEFLFTPAAAPGTELPEPATLGVLAIGLAGFAALSRRRRVPPPA